MVIDAGSEDQVVNALRISRELKLPLAIRGAGHSCFGQTVTDGVLLTNTPDPASVPRLLDNDLVEVSARSHWRQVESYLNGHGRSIAVLADYLDLSVGGTLSVGGYGADSVAHGAQVDQVVRLRLITPDGTALWCSAQDNAELFGFTLAGLGQVGVIESVVLRTIPYHPWTTLSSYRYQNLSELVDSLAWLNNLPVGENLLFKALHSRGRFVATYGKQSNTLRQAIAGMASPAMPEQQAKYNWVSPRYRQWRSLVVKLWVGQFSNDGRMWTDFLFDYDGLQEFAGFLAPLLNQSPFLEHVKSVYIVAVKKVQRSVSLPFEATDHFDAPMTYGIGIYSMIPQSDPQRASAVAKVMSACLDKCAELGGRPYRYGWHELNENQNRQFYGSAYDRHVAIKHELDPSGLFQCGSSVAGFQL